MRMLALGLGAALAFSSFAGHAASAAAVDSAGASKCSIRGYLSDPDPKGTNVRAAPRANAPVIGHLPPRSGYEGSNEMVGVEFEIIGSKDGWLLIQNPEKVAFNGPGWISGRLVGFTIGSPRLLAGPADNAKVVADLHGQGEEGFGPDSFGVLQVHACQGHFAEVTIALAPSIKPPPGKDKPMRGWVGKVCSNQLTTCDPY
jgi:hypothetical protein